MRHKNKQIYVYKNYIGILEDADYKLNIYNIKVKDLPDHENHLLLHVRLTNGSENILILCSIIMVCLIFVYTSA